MIFVLVHLIHIGIFFFFQAEDGIRDIGVTGVQTCALPILSPWTGPPRGQGDLVRDVLDDLVGWWQAGETVGVGTVVGTWRSAPRPPGASMLEIGRASCRERV